jgi:hypothetical protein
MCLDRGVPICGGLFVACHGILQYHLGGTLNAALDLAPMKLLLDEVRAWGAAQGLRVMHLGGGATANPDDPLLYFKRGFSDRRHQFSSWRWIVSPHKYALLCSAAASRTTDYFPAYRDPAVPVCPRRTGS